MYTTLVIFLLTKNKKTRGSSLAYAITLFISYVYRCTIARKNSINWNIFLSLQVDKEIL